MLVQWAEKRAVWIGAEAEESARVLPLVVLPGPAWPAEKAARQVRHHLQVLELTWWDLETKVEGLLEVLCGVQLLSGPLACRRRRS